MRTLYKPTLYILGVFGALYFGMAMLLVNFPERASEWQAANLSVSLMPYRLMVYLAIAGAWRWLAVWLTKPRGNPAHFSQELTEMWRDRQCATAKAWWKVAMFFALFELVAIQKVGF